jgi:folate-binding Fe-S cluster repair protein YgfZ
MSSFLTPKGRVMFDCMIVKPRLAGQNDEGEVEYWIDVEAENDASALMKHLKKYAIRKNLLVNDISHVIKTF